VTNQNTTNLYNSDQYLQNYPTLFEEHTPWKITRIIPLLDTWAAALPPQSNPINILDVGGGAGLLLKSVAEHLQTNHCLTVHKHALDLSPGMLEIQRRHNPDLHQALQGDITATAFPDKSIDLILMIDVLEHLENPAAALAELRRISRSVIFKVPLENHLVNNLSNLLNRGRTRRAHRQNLGHINFYTARSLKHQITTHLGPIIRFAYTDAFTYTLQNEIHTLTPALRIVSQLSAALHRIHPPLAARLFTDFAVILAHCD